MLNIAYCASVKDRYCIQDCGTAFSMHREIGISCNAPNAILLGSIHSQLQRMLESFMLITSLIRIQDPRRSLCLDFACD